MFLDIDTDYSLFGNTVLTGSIPDLQMIDNIVRAKLRNAEKSHKWLLTAAKRSPSPTVLGNSALHFPQFGSVSRVISFLETELFMMMGCLCLKKKHLLAVNCLTFSHYIVC